jgi:preprotein translocase subunit SecB
VLGIVCPGIIYPYLRANIADLINRTGLPSIHLAEINFEAMYQQRRAQMQQGIAPATPTRQ